jgi:16S rRNA C1402 (ribose-2'-O) methylase RsmI
MDEVSDDRISPVDRPALYLIPTPLSSGGAPWLTVEQREIIAQISTFFVENERSARRFLASLDLGRPVSLSLFTDLTRTARLKMRGDSLRPFHL